MTGGLEGLALGFADPTADAQVAFRCALDALARPGRAVFCAARTPRVPGLMPATAALLLALTDHETAVWWGTPEPARWLRFHTGAPPAPSEGDADYAVFAHGVPVPALDRLHQGGDTTPERSATLLIELPSFRGGPPVSWSGPGMAEPLEMRLEGLPARFWDQWHDNHVRFPSGVDVLFVCADDVLGLPRTTAVTSRRER
jgi:alpha-D-ribose 1-methylphosphonate 5-triphosphate synthase subunit PhnH